MAEANDTSSAPASAAGKRTGAGFELRLERGGAYVRLADQALAPGIRLEALTLQIPDVKFPFDVGQGAGQFRHRLSDLAELSVAVEPAAAALEPNAVAAFGVEDLRIAAREGFFEIAGRLSGGPAFTLAAGLLPAGRQGVSLVLHSPRVLGLAHIPAAALPHLGRSVLDAVRPDAIPAEPLAPLLRRLLAPRGWKLPRLADARLARVTIAGGAARIAWDRAAAGPAATPAHPDLLAADEGARTFRDAEALVARGDWDAAREAYLAAHGAAAHPFGAERLLALLSHEERFHDEALDLAAEWLSRRPGFGPALAAEGNVRLARGEEGRAAAAFAALAAGASERGESFLALAAAEAAYTLRGAAREDALRAVDIALRVRRDHLPALRALRTLARAAGDREALLRANRRLVAYESDPASKARAHAELGELLLAADPAGARLHLDHALRLAPDDVEALAALSRACVAAGEPLRAVRGLDRLKELLLARGDRAGAARAALEAGELWDGPLGHAENALLRFRDAAELAPGADAHARAARAAEKAGQWAEAADQHAAALALLDPAQAGSAALAASTRLALAGVAERLGDAQAAAGHLEKAAALAPGAPLLRRLAALQRSLGRDAEVMAALDRLATLEADPAVRATVLAEAGDIALALGLAGDARQRFTAAAAADASCRPALLGLARLARERGDAPAEGDALERLLPLCARGTESAEILDRLADARERAGDLAGALEASAGAREAAPALARLETSLRLARLVGDPTALAPLLADRARAYAQAGDPALAAAAWLERARLLAGTSPGDALAALAEARAVSPGDAGVLRAQAELAERTGDHRLALGCLRGLLAGGADDAASLELRAARAALAAGEVQAAKDHAQGAFERGVTGAAELLDDILDRAGDDAARADVLSRLGRHLEAARLFERYGDPARARAALERAAGDPRSAPQALPRLAELRLAEGDRAGAAAALLSLARLGDGRNAARLALEAHAAGGDPVALDLAVEKDPRFAPARARRAALRDGVDPRGALADAEAALEGDALPDDQRTGLLALAGRAAADAGDSGAARRHLAAYCQAVADDDAALAQLAALHRAAGAAEELARVLERRLPLAAPSQAAQVRLELSDLLAERDPARAAQLALDALERGPASAAALRAVTTAPRAAHVPPAARAALLARLAAHASATPEEASAALGGRARLLAEAGDDAGALAALREAARLGPEADDLLELRARLAGAAGESAEAARAMLERAGRAKDRQEPAAAERLAEAGLHGLAADVDGADEALRAALALEPERETTRAVLEGLVRRARERNDVAAEREMLPLLIPLLPTGARPAALLRVSGLALAANNTLLARASAEEARALAPRDLAAIEACRAAALAEGDLSTVAEMLAEAARVDPASSGARLLDRARLLVALRRHEDADDAYRAALAALPPDRALADEQARLRRDLLPGRPAAESIEAFALRIGDAAEAAGALRAAAALALSADDLPGALRCARRAYARTQDDPSFAGPLLARVLYLMGGAAEAAVLHRRLLETGFAGVAPEEAVALCRQAADLAEDAGERDLALRALDELLRLRPQEIEASLLRFALDPDRARAVQQLADAADACRSQRARVLALARAAEGALEATQDRDLSDRLFRRARTEADRAPMLALAVERRRAAALRRAEGASSPAFLEALHDAVDAAQGAGDRAAARDLLEEAVTRERERGLFGEAARDLLHLDALAAADGDFAESPARLRAAGALQREAGDLAAATATLQRAYAAAPDSEETFERLEDLLRARGAEAAPLLVELLADRAARAGPGPERADALVRLADAHAAAGGRDDAEAALRASLAEIPGYPAAEDRLLDVLAETRRTGERARLLLERSARLPEGDARTDLRREAASALAASSDPLDRELAAEAWRAVAAARPSDLEAARAAAGLLVGLGRREDAIPHLTALVRADPDDEAAAGELAEAYAGRPADLAELLLARAAHASGEARATRLRGAAAALFSIGQDARARTALHEAFEAWPADDVAFAGALRDAGSNVDRVAAVLVARARAVPAEAASCHRTRADTLQAAGRMEEAIAAYEAAAEADPHEPSLAAALAACLADARGDAAAAVIDRQIIARAEAEPGKVPGATEAPSRFRIGLALSFAGRTEESLPHLERAVSLAPFDGRAGLAWAALAQGHATRGDAAVALAAARARTDRATALGLEEEKRAALEAEEELMAQLGVPSDVRSEPGAEPAEPAAREPPTPEVNVPGVEPMAQAPEEPVAFEGRAPEEPFSFEPLAAEEQPVSFESPTQEGALEPSAAAADPAAEETVAFEPHASEEPIAFEPGPAEEQPVAFEPPSLEEQPQPAAFEAPPSHEPFAFEAAAAEEQPVAFEPAPSDEPALSEHAAPDQAPAPEQLLASAPDAPRSVQDWIASAELLERAGATADEIRAEIARAREAHPDAPEPWLALARLEATLGDQLRAARAQLSAAVRAEGEDAVRAAIEAARLFEEGSRHADAARAYRVALHSRPDAVPAPVLLAAEALAAGDAQAAARHLAAVSPPDLPEPMRGDHLQKLARALEAAGMTDEAERVWGEILLAAPEALEADAPPAEDAPAPRDLPDLPEIMQPAPVGLDAGIAAGQDAGSATVAPPPAAPAADAQALARDGRARMEQGDLAGAYDQLSLALAAEPSDVTIARDLSRVAEKLGLYAEYVQLGEICADAIAAYDPLAAAARYRHFAQVLRDRIAAPDRAGVMLEKALALVPEDPDTRRELIAVWAGRSETAPRALDAWLDLARKDPSDVTALAAVASLCQRIAPAGGEGAPRLVERGRLAGSIAAFMSPSHPPPPPAPLAREIPVPLRARVAAPGALGPLARLLRLLAPSLETLFPADLRRRGTSPPDALDRQRAPAVAAAFDGASRALGVRPFTTLVSSRPGIEASIENTRPPAVIVGEGVAVLDDAALAFLAARTLDLLDHGWALVGKFAPKDVGILLELACRFAGGAPPPLGLPRERAGAFLSVLESQVPAAVRAEAAELGAAASQELAETDPRALAAAVRRTANRVGLLYVGDPGAALRILALLDRRLDAGTVDPGQALALPDLRDLALFALSDPFLELRAAALGNIPAP